MNSRAENGVFNIPEFSFVLQWDIRFWLVIVDRQLFTVGLVPLRIQFCDSLILGKLGDNGVNRFLNIFRKIAVYLFSLVTEKLFDQLVIYILHFLGCGDWRFGAFQQLVDPFFRRRPNLIAYLCFQRKGA